MRNKRIRLTFTTDARDKMVALVQNFDTEVEWHGTAVRTRKGFMVKDILLFPHRVSACTVTSDQNEYEQWLDSLPDAQFNELRFHGHSHVNMATHPSGVDMNYRRNMVRNIPKGAGGFYIFMILNKRGEWTAEIYDVASEKIYREKDIYIRVADSKVGDLEEFVRRAKTLTSSKERVCFESPFDMNVLPEAVRPKETVRYRYYGFNEII